MPDEKLMLTPEERGKFCYYHVEYIGEVRIGITDWDIENLLQAQLSKLQANGWGDIEQAKREERERMIEWSIEDCPHRTMANFEGEPDISLRHKAECWECWQALKEGE